MDLKNKTVLVTGGTGSIGSEIVRQLLKQKAGKIIIYSRDDSKLFYLKNELNSGRVKFVVGDVRDKNSLKRVFLEGIDIVIHAAALKHVSFCEEYPFEAVMTNVYGTQNVVDLSVEFDIEIMLTISTDKAVNPSSSMGATKYIAEKLTINANRASTKTRFACVRFGNVLGTRGSVIPAFLKSISEKGYIRVTDLEVTRFVMPIIDAARLVTKALNYTDGGEIFVMKMKSMSLRTLVEVFKDVFAKKSPFDVRVIGSLPGEKLHEELVTFEETARLWEIDDFYVIAPNISDWNPSRIKNREKVNLEYYASGEGTFYDFKTLKKVVIDEIKRTNAQ